MLSYKKYKIKSVLTKKECNNRIQSIVGSNYENAYSGTIDTNNFIIKKKVRYAYQWTPNIDGTFHEELSGCTVYLDFKLPVFATTLFITLLVIILLIASFKYVNSGEFNLVVLFKPFATLFVIIGSVYFLGIFLETKMSYKEIKRLICIEE